jgi:hypothetical protein
MKAEAMAVKAQAILWSTILSPSQSLKRFLFVID